MAERHGSLVAARTGYENSIDRNLSLASRALSEIATLVERAGADGTFADDEVDIDLSKVGTLKAINERAIEISKIYNRIYDLETKTIAIADLILLSQLLQKQLDDISKYKRDDKVKECLEALEKSYFELADDHCIFCKALREDADLEREEEREDVVIPTLKRGLSFSERAAIFSDEIQHSFKEMQKSIIDTVSFSSRTQAIYHKIATTKKYKVYLAAAALGIIALGLTIACPPAAGCAAVITASYVFGLADGAAGTVLASRDIYNSVEEDMGAYDARQSLQDKIKELRDSRQKKSIDPDKQIDPDKETKKILRYFNEQAISIASDIIREKINVVDGICTDEYIDPALRKSTKAGIQFCQSMLSTSDEIKMLNTQLISLFKTELQSDSEHPQNQEREEIVAKFSSLITKLDRLKEESEKLDIPKPQREEVSRSIDENAKQLRDMKSDFTEYLSSSKEFRLEKAKSIQSKIALSKRNKLISGIGMTLAVISLGLAIACPFVGPPLVGAAIAVFATQLIVGAVATAIAANDFKHAQKEISKSKAELREEQKGIDDLSVLQQRLESLETQHHDPLSGDVLSTTTEIIGAGAHRAEHSSATTPQAHSAKSPSPPSTSPQPSRDRP